MVLSQKLSAHQRTRHRPHAHALSRAQSQSWMTEIRAVVVHESPLAVRDRVRITDMIENDVSNVVLQDLADNWKN